jgi:ABC-type Fe3+/spermidine/putrescine transport system ATPase subunit
MQVGSPDDLYNYPENRFVADFIGETNFLTGEVVSREEQACTIKLDETTTMKGLFRDTFPQPEKWATYSLRPEKVLVAEAAEHVENSYEGTVQEFLYLGEFTKYRIALSPSIELSVKATNRKGRKLLAKGEKTAVGWEREEMLLVESDVPPHS